MWWILVVDSPFGSYSFQLNHCAISTLHQRLIATSLGTFLAKSIHTARFFQDW